MTPEEVRDRVSAEIDGAQVEVFGEGDRFEIRVVSPAFEGLKTLQRHKLVNGCIQDWISDGSIHAVSIRTRTPEEQANAGD